MDSLFAKYEAISLKMSHRNDFESEAIRERWRFLLLFIGSQEGSTLRNQWH